MLVLRNVSAHHVDDRPLPPPYRIKMRECPVRHGSQMRNNQPLIDVAIEPASVADKEKLAEALAALVAEDHAFCVTKDVESGQTILRGVSEKQLDEKVGLIAQVYNIQANIGAPQVAYREKIGRAVTVDHTHRRQTGGSGQFARVKIVSEPLPPDGGFQLENEAGDAVPEEFIAGIERGLQSVLG
jgi:elongation factor G